MIIPGQCIEDCSILPDGNYQSCHGCNMYAACSNGQIVDQIPCHALLVWDDNLKSCEYTSQTCSPSIQPTPAPIPGPTTDYTPGICVPHCANMPDGDYQSCHGCNVFVTCSNHITYMRSCPGELVWDDILKRCEYTSQTCSVAPPTCMPVQCVATCSGMVDGDYHSCHGCKYYVTCSNGITTDKIPCRSGQLWDDILKQCEYNSQTCSDNCSPHTPPPLPSPTPAPDPTDAPTPTPPDPPSCEETDESFSSEEDDSLDSKESTSKQKSKSGSSEKKSKSSSSKEKSKSSSSKEKSKSSSSKGKSKSSSSKESCKSSSSKSSKSTSKESSSKSNKSKESSSKSSNSKESSSKSKESSDKSKSSKESSKKSKGSKESSKKSKVSKESKESNKSTKSKGKRKRRDIFGNKIDDDGIVRRGPPRMEKVSKCHFINFCPTCADDL